MCVFVCLIISVCYVCVQSNKNTVEEETGTAVAIVTGTETDETKDPAPVVVTVTKPSRRRYRSGGGSRDPPRSHRIVATAATAGAHWRFIFVFYTRAAHDTCIILFQHDKSGALNFFLEYIIITYYNYRLPQRAAIYNTIIWFQSVGVHFEIGIYIIMKTLISYTYSFVCWTRVVLIFIELFCYSIIIIIIAVR